MTDRSIDSIFNQPKEATMQAHESSFKEMLNPPATPVFDFTATINAALAQAIALATTPLVERIELLERSLVVADKAAQGNESDLFSRVALLEDKMDNYKEIDESRFKEIVEEVAQAAMYDHTSEYDHDEYDRFDDRVEEKVNEAIDDLDMEDKLRDTLRNMTFSITARY